MAIAPARAARPGATGRPRTSSRAARSAAAARVGRLERGFGSAIRGVSASCRTSIRRSSGKRSWSNTPRASALGRGAVRRAARSRRRGVAATGCGRPRPRPRLRQRGPRGGVEPPAHALAARVAERTRTGSGGRARAFARRRDGARAGRAGPPVPESEPSPLRARNRAGRADPGRVRATCWGLRWPCSASRRAGSTPSPASSRRAWLHDTSHWRRGATAQDSARRTRARRRRPRRAARGGGRGAARRQRLSSR